MLGAGKFLGVIIAFFGSLALPFAAGTASLRASNNALLYPVPRVDKRGRLVRSRRSSLFWTRFLQKTGEIGKYRLPSGHRPL